MTNKFHNSNYKTQVCNKFPRCPFGAKCQFAHGYDELRLRKSQSSTASICRACSPPPSPPAPPPPPPRPPGLPSTPPPKSAVPVLELPPSLMRLENQTLDHDDISKIFSLARWSRGSSYDSDDSLEELEPARKDRDEPSPLGFMPPVKNKSKYACVVCSDKTGTVSYPCLCLAVCSACVPFFYTSNKTCPVCTRPVRAVFDAASRSQVRAAAAAAAR